ncbi:MAG: hypothetical protein GX660_21320 [Clostridiaceae bacterium]|nr:hypothetical protein [Clostridiaceae bacterium]
MSSIVSIIASVSNQLESDTRKLNDKKNNLDKVWISDAKKVFIQRHGEMEAHMKDALNRLNNLNDTVRSLNKSVGEADRDKKAKKNKKASK